MKGRMAIALIAVFAAVGAGCSDGSETTTTAAETTTSASADASDAVVFDSGALPATIPEEFPIPAGSSIGTTMVIRATGFTEVVIRVATDTETLADFFDQALSQNGFSVDRSEVDGDVWVIEFSDDTAAGSLEIDEPAGGVTQTILRYNVP